jgi:hypothetical protein
MTFQAILEASIDELAAHLLSDSADSSLETSYAEAILSFLRCDNEALQTIINRADHFADHPEGSLFKLACQLRLAIRLRQMDSSLIDQVEASPSNSRWQGELRLLGATLLTVGEENERALKWFTLARLWFFKAGYTRKALRARMNELVALSHLDSEKTLLAEYHDLYRWSIRKANRDLIVATTCTLNMAREYQRAGARLCALSWCAKGLKLAQLQFGSRNHHFLLAQKTDLLLQLDRRAEASLVYDEVKLSPFPEVQAALRVLEHSFELKTSLVAGTASPKETPPLTATVHLLPTWRERIYPTKTPSTLSKLEDQLVSFLSTGPRERSEILNHLYGDSLAYGTKLNRFKSLLTTLRRKSAEIVRYKDGQYELTDRIAVPALVRRSKE